MESYSWTQDYQRTWETITKKTEEEEKEVEPTEPHFRPLLRRLVLILDYSKSATKKDFKPNRHKLMSQTAEEFYSNFYSHNPLSNLKMIIAKSGKAFHIPDVSQLQLSADGEFSLQNSLEMALYLLESTGEHWSSEILIIQSSLNTCDPGNIWETIEKAQKRLAKITVISLCPEVFAMKEATLRTGGKFILIDKAEKLKEEWENIAYTGNPASYESLVPMAFPYWIATPTPCACHLKINQGYICPICKCKVCTLPIQCPVCNFILVSTPHLNKAALSLTPLPPFNPVLTLKCTSCEKSSVSQCPKCSTIYCSDCEEFVRTSLGKCLGCSF
ncbi:unnamed protein product [Blepharisma stoltei]|uniref:TFIIH C1-like domain-containing protein n=1 Tax=Blepharisma stoltei TaxID=1481888 RepID=A0AAU9JMN2_9CILI|nr:unnamed protein product [Blepharisma stoltei]